ncbi:MAG: carboxypeptidase regulatory-like domain-containing protein [Acidobacteria bacterium]|nr:carboxypeptidase regulatory-like domain-containing protein [Acidobacteriota bacterium]
MKRVLSIGGAVLLGLVLGLGGASAQTGQNFGEITGKTLDQQGAIIPGVTVTVSGPAMMGVKTAITNEHGAYRFPAVPSGLYKITFELAGFASYIRDGVVVAVRATVTIDAPMKLATLSETVTVTGASPVVDVENAKVGQRLDKEILSEIPSQRTIFGSTTMLPGMVMGVQDVGGLYSGTSTGMVAHGSTQYNLNYFGVSTDTPQDYGSMYYMDYGSAEEISVDTAAMGAEIGGPGGANINVIPKSGSNRLKGTFYFTGANKGMVGDNIDDNLRKQGITVGTRVKQLLDINADIGGPVLRDKVWYYVSYRKYKTQEDVIGFPKVFQTQLINYVLRTTYKLSQNNNLSAFWTFNRKNQPNRDASATRPPESTWFQISDKNLENLNWTSVIGQNTFSELSSSFMRMYWPTYYSKEWDGKTPASYNTTTGVYWGAHASGERFRDARRFQLNGAVTHYRDGWMGGNHQMKAGFEYWIGFGTDGLRYFGDTFYRYRNVSGVQTPYEIRTYNTPLDQKTHMKNISVFAQDRVSFKRMTINLGLRYALYDGYLPEQTGGGLWFPRTTYPKLESGFAWKTWAPRLGFVYKVTSDARNVAKVSFGRYFNHMYTWHFSDVINPNVLRTSGLNIYTWYGDLNGNGVVDANEYNPNPKSVFSPKNNRIDPGFSAPQTDEITLGFQREVGANIGLSVSWIQRWFTKQWADVNQFPAGAYVPASFPDYGPDNLKGTADDTTITAYNLQAAYLGTDAFVRRNVPGTLHYKSLELSFNRRMANRWQLQASYVWSKLDGPVWVDSGGRQAEDPNDPNAQINVVGRGGYDQPHAIKIIGSFQAPWDISLGLNFQALSGQPTNRNLVLALTQGSTTVRAEAQGTYRADWMNLLSFRGAKSIRMRGGVKATVFAEVHNLLNTNAAQALYSTTQGFASQAEFDANMTKVSYFGRISSIIAPRVLKAGFKFEF